MRRSAAIAVTVLAVTAAGCSGIPHSSKPSAVESIGVEQNPGVQVQSPPPGANPRTIVNDFLVANGAQDPVHDGAYEFLTPAAQSTWDPGTVTIIANEQVGVFTANSVVVTGNEIGTIDHNGVFTPTLAGDGAGNGEPTQSFTYAIGTSGGQNRITRLPAGLLLTTAQFEAYRQYTIYFYDNAQQHLIPDPRWSRPLDPPALAQFLIGQLVKGPRGNPQADESTALPTQSDPTRVLVSTVPNGPDAGVTKIEVPQARQSVATLDLLAAQLAHTLVPQVTTANQLEITDGGTPVTIPAARSAIFTADDVITPYVATPNSVQLYYINSIGGVVDESGKPLPGPIGRGSYKLDSAAITSGGGAKQLLVAATRGGRSALDVGYVGDNTSLMVAAKLPQLGPLSRPDWAPGGEAAWVGDGNRLFRVLPNGTIGAVNLIEPSGIATKRISAVRLSPEGSRVALVLNNADGSAQIWIGTIVAGANGATSVFGLAPISPQGVDIEDVAWNDELKLFAVGHEANNFSSGVFEVQVDGSLWTSDGFANLPSPPDNITASQGFVASVSSGGTIWEQAGATWASLKGATGTIDAKGSDPIYST